MGASIEWLIGVVRAGDKHEKFGDPWTHRWLATVEGDVIHFFAVESKGEEVSILKERNAIRKLIPEGIKEVRWERIRNGETKSVTRKV